MRKKYLEKRFKDYRQIINHSAQKYKDKAAFMIKNKDCEDIQISYLKLREMYYALCKQLLEQGLKGKAIAISGKNSFNWTLAYLCAATVGIAVPLDKEMSTEDKLFFMKEAKCEAVFGDEKILEELSRNQKNIKTWNLDEEFQIKNCILREDVEAIDKINISKKKPQIIIFTSGTTGSAKGVCLSQYNICSNIHSTVSTVKITPKDRTLSLLPLHHTYECTLNCLLMLSRGACITYCDRLARVKKSIQEYSPSVLVVVPAVLNLMSKQIKKNVIEKLPKKYQNIFLEKDFASAMAEFPWVIRRILKKKVRNALGGNLRLFIVGAASTDPEIIRMFDALGIRTLQGYGLTECSPLLAGNSDFYMNPYSTGKAVPGVSLMINNPNEEGIGEILAKGDNIMLGYFKDKKATEKTFEEGWFKTGDLGYLDEEGHLYIKGRVKNVIVTSNGKNIYSEELEKRLTDTDQIKECLVLGVDEKGEQVVKAKVVADIEYIKEALGYEPSKEEIENIITSVVEKINGQMAPYKRIKRVQVIDEFEKTTTQKIKRYGKNLE